MAAFGAMLPKRSHLGMAGHYAAMSEFLLRGYNVAVPTVDVGDDVFVVDDRDGTLWRVQVKTGSTSAHAIPTAKPLSIQCQLSRRQLREAKPAELFFMLMARWGARWRFVLISRRDLERLRDAFESRSRSGQRGRKPRRDADASSDALSLKVEWTEGTARAWGTSLDGYLDQWPADFPILDSGPGAVRPRPRRSPGS